MEAVDLRKQKKISKAALYYYSSHGFAEGIPCRFDVLAVWGDGKMEHLQNAFEFSYKL
jgi:putative endonuclease